MGGIPRLLFLAVLVPTFACASLEGVWQEPAAPPGDDAVHAPPGDPAAETTPTATDAAPPPTGDPGAPLQPPGTEEALWESLLNRARAQPRECGGQTFAAAPPLGWDPRLGAVAREHSRDMAEHGALNHNSSDGRTPWDRIAAAGYPFATVAENVAAGQPDAQAAVESWLRSPGHCANIMNPEHRDFGAAGERGSDGTTYWTLKLGSSF